MRKLVEQLPDAFELMSQALRAGHSLASGIQLVSEQMPDPIGTEFGRVFQEQNLGIKIEDALLSMGDRCGQLCRGSGLSRGACHRREPPEIAAAGQARTGSARPAHYQDPGFVPWCCGCQPRSPAAREETHAQAIAGVR